MTWLGTLSHLMCLLAASETYSRAGRPLSRAAVRFPAGADHIRLARRRAELRRTKFGWRRRQTFPAAAAAEFGASS